MQYSAGTATVIEDSQTVTFDGTDVQTYMDEGHIFTVPGHNTWYDIVAVDPVDQEITISPAWAGATTADTEYVTSSSFTPEYGIPYPEQGDHETASIVKRAILEIEQKILNFGAGALIAGAIVFGGSGQAFAQDSANLSYDDTANVLSVPSLQASGSVRSAGIVYADNSGASIRLRADGTDAKDGYVSSSTDGTLYLAHWDGSGAMLKYTPGKNFIIGSFATADDGVNALQVVGSVSATSLKATGGVVTSSGAGVNLVLQANGGEIMRLFNAGNVGIGYASDDGVNRLQVAGSGLFSENVTIGGGAGNKQLIITSTSAAAYATFNGRNNANTANVSGYIGALGTSSFDGLWIETTTNHPIRIGVNSTEIAQFTSTGFTAYTPIACGAFSTSPTSNYTEAMYLLLQNGTGTEQGATTPIWWSPASATAALSLAGGRRVTANINGLSVGATGAMNPMSTGATQHLTVESADGHAALNLYGAASSAGQIDFGHAAGVRDAQISSLNGGGLVTTVGASVIEASRITAGGFSKFSNDGTYMSSVGNYHELRSNVADNNVLQLSHTHATAPYGPTIYFGGGVINNATNYFLYMFDTGGARAVFYSNGGLHNYSANNVNLCDVSVKNIEGELGPQRERFRKLAIVQGSYRDAPDNTGVPFWMAQQVAHVYPEFVTRFDEKSRSIGVKEHALQMMSYKVIQELDEAVLDHDAQIGKLLAFKRRAIATFPELAEAA